VPLTITKLHVLGQCGRGCSVAILRGVRYDRSDVGITSMLHW
jgi:hypothetical protein